MASKKTSVRGKAGKESVPNASRRGFLKGSLAFVGGAAAVSFASSDAEAQQAAAGANLLQRLRTANGRPILFKGGVVLSVDPKVGDFENGDVLIQGKKIVAVGQHVTAPANALVVDASNRILMPGMIDTHHHSTDTALRSLASDSIILEFPNAQGPKRNYASIMRQLGTGMTPEDTNIAELVFGLSAIDSGTTAVLDVSVTNGYLTTPALVDGAIAGMKKAGGRVLYLTSGSGADAPAKLTAEIARLQKQYFSSTDQLITLGVNGGPPDAALFRVAKSFHLPIAIHFWGKKAPLEPVDGLLGPDVVLIHFSQVLEKYWKMAADAGANISIAPAIDMQMRQGYPAVQQALDHGMQPSLSSDVSINMAADGFTLMRTAYLAQRAEINNRVNGKEKNVPPLLTCRQAIEFATIRGAKALQLDAKLGSLTPGKEADLIMLATDRINLFPLNNAPAAIVTLMDTSNVDAVFIAGQVMKWQGKLVGVDLNQLQRAIEKSRDGVLARSGYPRDMFGTCCGPELPDASAE